MNNIILIGMTGAGKTTVGKLLAERYGMEFVDTDRLIAETTSLTPREIVSVLGKEKFKEIQDEVVANLSISGGVIATGGSMVESDSAMKRLKTMGKLFYLQVEFDILKSRLDPSRPLAGGGMTFYELFCQRQKLYRKYADMICDCKGKSIEDIAAWVMQKQEEVNI